MDLEMLIDSFIEYFELYEKNEKYTIYYDETNNPIKIQYKENDTNIDLNKLNKNYLLGGVAFKEKPTNIEELIKDLDFQENFKEIKFKLICNKRKDLIECLKSKKLNILLKWIDNNDLYIHAFIFNNMYDLVVEIIDSILANKKIGKEILWDIDAIKSSFYNFILNNWDSFNKLLIKYNYPNINNVQSFCNDIINMINNYDIDDFYLKDLCLDLLITGSKQKELIFLINNEDNALIDSYAQINYERVTTFPNSTHYFDDITCIKEKMESAYLHENKNFTFINSKSDYYIQLSDVIINIIYRYYSFLSKSEEEIKEIVNNLDNISKENLMLIINLLDKSHNENIKLITRYDSKELIERQNDNVYLIKRILHNKTLKRN